MEHIEAAVAAGRGVVLALPHLGNWDMAGAWLALQGYTVTVVAEPVEPPELFDWFVETRARLGMRVIALSPSAGTEVLQAVRNNEVVCLLSDRDLTGDGIEVEFFGERTTLPGGPAILALRGGAPLVAVGCYFRPHGYHEAQILAPVPAGREGRLRDDLAPRHPEPCAPLRGAHPGRADPLAPPPTELAERPCCGRFGTCIVIPVGRSSPLME